jgi:hypothetical protein
MTEVKEQLTVPLGSANLQDTREKELEDKKTGLRRGSSGVLRMRSFFPFAFFAAVREEQEEQEARGKNKGAV